LELKRGFIFIYLYIGAKVIDAEHNTSPLMSPSLGSWKNNSQSTHAC
jgi:hypothetical protein